MKDKLQQELLEKIKPGTKPSDLKKRAKKLSKTSQSPPPMEISRSDSGYESDHSNKSIPKAPALPNSQIQDLQSQISSLKKQFKVYKDFKEADLKIKEDLKKSLWALNKDQEGYKETIKELSQELENTKKRLRESFEERSLMNKTIEELKNQAKSTVNIKSEPQETKTFLCSECKQTKPQSELSRVFDSFSFCLNCSKKARQTAKQKQKPNPEPQPFTCVVCDEPKQAVPIYKKVDISYKTHLVKGQAYPVCASCSTYVKEYNEHENQEFSIGED
jgi:chromosome segregation ATPase